jgi:hypothetical protein
MNQPKYVFGLLAAGALFALGSCSKEMITPAPAADVTATRTLGELIQTASPELYANLQQQNGRGPEPTVVCLTGKFHMMADYPNGGEHWTCMQLDNRFCIAIVRPAEQNLQNPDEILSGLNNGTITGSVVSAGEINNLPVSSANYWFIENDENPSARKLASISAQQNGSVINGVCSFK